MRLINESRLCYGREQFALCGVKDGFYIFLKRVPLDFFVLDDEDSFKHSDKVWIELYDVKKFELLRIRLLDFYAIECLRSGNPVIPTKNMFLFFRDLHGDFKLQIINNFFTKSEVNIQIYAFV